MKHRLPLPFLAAATLVLLSSNAGAQATLTVQDPLLGTSSAGTLTLDATQGHTLDFRVAGAPGDLALLALAFNPAPPGTGSIGGVPIGLDPAGVFFLGGAQLLDGAGVSSWSLALPAGVPVGIPFWSQAPVVELPSLSLALTQTVALTTAAPHPGDVPLLLPGKHVGLIYSEASPAGQVAMDAAWAESVAAGVDSYELAISWTDIEVSPGVYDTSSLQALLAILSSAQFETFLVVSTIDTVNLNLPWDLTDPLDPNELAPGLTWDHPTVLTRFGLVLDQIVPLLEPAGVFFLSVGNEVDGYLASRPQQHAAYANFVDAARVRVRGLEPELGVGATMTFETLSATPQLFGLLRAAGDNVPFTYYAMNADMTVQDPSVAPGDIAAMSAAVAPRALLIQEIGYPSGTIPVPTNGSSTEKQRKFVELAFGAFAAEPRLRFVSWLHLGDWGPATIAIFEQYYGISAPLFLEFLATLGLREYATGAAKPAYAQFLLEVGKL